MTKEQKEQKRALKEQKKQEKLKKKAEKKQIKSDKAYVKWFRFLRGLERFVRIFYPYKKYCAVKDYGNGPYVMVCNHFRMWDILYPVSIIARPVHFMAKKELWKHSALEKFCNKCRCIPVSRDGGATDVKAIMSAMKYLKNGENIAIFPEGTRNKSKEPLLPFKGGFVSIAIKTQTPILPIMQLKKAKLFRKSHVAYGKPLEFSEFYGKKLTEEDIAYCENLLRDTMLKMREELIEKLNSKKRKKS